MATLRITSPKMATTTPAQTPVNPNTLVTPAPPRTDPIETIMSRPTRSTKNPKMPIRTARIATPRGSWPRLFIGSYFGRATMMTPSSRIKHTPDWTPPLGRERSEIDLPRGAEEDPERRASRTLIVGASDVEAPGPARNGTCVPFGYGPFIRRFPTFRTRVTTMGDERRTTGPDIQCADCDSSFSSASELRRHEVVTHLQWTRGPP